MSKAYTESTFSDLIDSDLVWRRKELSDLRSAILAADSISKEVLLKSLITISYAHWEGYVRSTARKYFEFLSLRKNQYKELERQIYRNNFLVRLDSLFQSKSSVQTRCDLIEEILSSHEKRFSYVNPTLIDTRSNLNTDVIKDICIICGIDYTHFEENRAFIDIIILKRRNAIAHGQYENVSEDDIDKIITNILSLMGQFKTLLENKVYTKAYLAA